MGVATDGLATVTVIGQQFGFVSDADLPHLDPRLQFRRQRLYQFAKIDSLFRQIVDHNPLAAKQVLELDKFHVEIEFFDDPVASLKFTRLLRLDVAVFVDILRSERT